jgi:hypothetical protein
MKSREPNRNDELTVTEAGRRGGTTTRDRHGLDFYREIGTKGGESTKRLYGHLFSEYGKRGGRPRRPSLENSMGGGLPVKKGAERSAPRGSPPT